MQVRPGLRVVSSDYGRGTIVAVAPSEMHIQWDKPYMPDSQTHLLAHDLGFAAQLEEIHEDEDGKTVPANLP